MKYIELFIKKAKSTHKTLDLFISAIAFKGCLKRYCLYLALSEMTRASLFLRASKKRERYNAGFLPWAKGNLNKSATNKGTSQTSF